MTRFHNPYHFVPLAKTGSRTEGETPLPPHVTHDRYVEGMHSGQITCRVTIETPTLCGNRIEPRTDWANIIHPFDLNGQPAIPGSQLRGMISSVAEAASNSAMRVLADRTFTFRNEAEDGLTAMGMLINRNGDLCLYPLTGPHRSRGTPLPKRKGGDYSTMFLNDRPKYSFASRHEIQAPQFLRSKRTSTDPSTGPFYGVLTVGLQAANTHSKNQIILGKILPPRTEILPWSEIPEMERAEYTRGILRVLGLYRDRSIPNTKLHEYFIPYSIEEQATIENETAKLYPLDILAEERFDFLADERASAKNSPEGSDHSHLPYGPHEVSRGRPQGKRPASSWKLKHGDIVFFRPSRDGQSVSEISLSAVWRDRVDLDPDSPSAAASMVSFLNIHDMGDLAPWHADRSQLTPAELLFGVVSRNEQTPGGLQALGGRVKFGHATLKGSDGWLPAEDLWSDDQKASCMQMNKSDVPLQNLASPKTPCPSLYFTPVGGGGGYIAKSDLSPLYHLPQGRKFYLRRPKAEANDPTNEAFYVGKTNAFVHGDRLRNPEEHMGIGKQHQSVEKFIRVDSELVFKIRFDNLTDDELNLLVYALSPTESFRHQIGHGKPLGFGQMHLEVQNIELVNRQTRYSSAGFYKNRYEPPSEGEIKDLVGKRAKAWRETASCQGLGAVLNALEAVGDPSLVIHSVHYPQVNDIERNTAAFEQNFYQWFTNNQRKTRDYKPGQYLAPLTDQDGWPVASLPALERERTPNPPQTHYFRPESKNNLALGEVVEGTFSIRNPGDTYGFVHLGIPGGNQEDLFLHRSQTENEELPTVGTKVRVRVIENPRNRDERQASMRGVVQP